MPQESPTPVERGQGSIDPTFTPPQTGVATPGRQLQAEPTSFEQFRDAVVTAGRGVASAVSARAAISSRLRSLKEQSVSRVEGDLNRAARGLQQRRLDRALAQRQEILVEAETRGVEYAERRFRSAMLNASSAEEARLWEQGWSQARTQISRDNEEADQQRFNAAARTMEQTALSLNQQLAESPELEAGLIGDGQGIGQRVQDWLLTEIQNGVDLDSLSEEDADVLIHQAIKQSFRISDGLTRKHIERVEKSNESLGTQQISADIYSTLAGEQDPQRLRRQIEVSIRDRLNHLTPEQQRDYVRREAAQSVQQLASGQFGIDALDKIGTASSLLNMKVDGVPLFTEGERVSLAADVLGRAQKTAAGAMDAEVARLRELQADVVTLPDGRIVRRPSATADANLLIPDPETGLSMMDEAMFSILSRMGLDADPSELSPEGAAIVGAVRSRAGQVQDRLSTEIAKRAKKVSNANTILSGQPGGDANNYVSFSMERRARQTPDALSAAGEAPLSGNELVVLKAELEQRAADLGVPASVVQGWDGSAVEYTDENVELNRLLSVNEARKWSNAATQAQYGMPSELVREKMALLSSNDPNRVGAFAEWARALEAGNNEAWDNFLSAEGVNSNDAAAAIWVRTHARLGDATDPSSALTNEGQIQPDYLNLMAQVQAIQGARPLGSWMQTDTGDTELVTSNGGNMAQVLADIFTDEAGAEFEPDERDRYNRRVQAQVEAMFLSDQDSLGRWMRSIWFAGRTVNTDLNDAQVGAMVYQWLRKDHYRFRTNNGKVTLVQDPQGYTGQAGQDIGEHVSNHFHREFIPEYRAFLQEAMDLKPKDVPVNLQSMFFTEGFAGTDPRSPVLTPRWSINEQVTDRLHESRAGYGGFVIGAESNGEVLSLPVSKKDAMLNWPDGTSVFVPKGTALSVINPDLFAPLPYRGPVPTPRLGSQFTPPESTTQRRVSGQGTSRNIPVQ